MKITEIIKEGWSQKYKSSINCSHPKGFSQKAHCAGKKKHNESVDTEMVCEDCGMCATHGDNLLEVKQRLDAKCWKGKHKEGTKIKGGVRVNNCVPNESMSEADELRARGGIEAVNKKPRPGQTDYRDIPAGNYPGSKRKFSDKDREEQPGRLKAAIKSTLGKHTRPDLPEQAVVEGEKKGLYYNVNKRKAAGTSRDASSPKAPTAQAWKDAAKTAKKEGVAATDETFMPVTPTQTQNPITKKIGQVAKSVVDKFKSKSDIDKEKEDLENFYKRRDDNRAVADYERTGDIFPDTIKETSKPSVVEGLDELARVLELSGLNLTADEQFDIIEEMVEQLAQEHGVDAEVIWEDFESVDDDELLESAAWRRSEGKSKKGGLNAKGVASYRRENPGSKLQTAVTTKPSKLKAGSKAAKRRKSFCARMGGVKGPMKKPNGKPTRKALALRKWNC